MQMSHCSLSKIEHAATFVGERQIDVFQSVHNCTSWLKTVWISGETWSRAHFMTAHPSVDVRESPRCGGVADEWVTQLLRQGDAKVFKKYSQMKLQMKREAQQKFNRQENESWTGFDTGKVN